MRHPRTIVDLGCHDYDGEWPSLEALVDTFHPDVIYGFDPAPELDTERESVNGVPAKLEKKAAWLYDGELAYTPGQIEATWGTVGSRDAWSWPGLEHPYRVGISGEGDETVECFDFSAWLRERGPALVKMDIEGAEYALLDRMIMDGTTRLVEGLVIEWHHWVDKERLAHFDCPVERWCM